MLGASLIRSWGRRARAGSMSLERGHLPPTIRGLAEATGDIVAFLDDDAEPEAPTQALWSLNGSVSASSHVVDLRTVRGHLCQRRCCSPRGSDRRPALDAVARWRLALRRS